ncbi:MAG: glycosyltransferase family A protein [Patescibacteria group bacterium]
MDQKKPPLVSIIIPAYQHARELPACLMSVFAQIMVDFEVIVINDGSTDDTDQAIEPFLSRLTYIKQENRGGNAARNRGFHEARGRFLLFCDADLILRPDCLHKMLVTLEQHPAESYAYCSFRYGWKKFTFWPFDDERLRQMNFIHTSSLIRSEHFPGFDETIRKLQDWDLWLTMLEAGHRGVWIPEVLFRAIPHRGGISTWMPGIFYRIPWSRFGIRLPAIEKFHEAERIIKKKHGL